VTEIPLRLSFLRGVTDFDDFYLNHSGAVLSTGASKYVYAIAKEHFNNLVYVNYSQRNVDNIDKQEQVQGNL